jgi:hypothetical protein
MTWTRLFVTPEEHRPRALWRLLGFGLLLVAVTVGLVVGGGLLVPSLFALDGGSPVALLLVSAAGTVVAVVVAAHYLDRRVLADLGFRVDGQWLADLGFGLALGAGLMAAIFLLELALGWATVTGTFQPAGAFLPGFLAGVGVFLVVGFYEELFARGYLLTNVAEGLVGYAGRLGAVAVAVVLTSAVFGCLHAANPGATALSVLSIGLAGVWLAVGYVTTGELAVPIGAHVTWNTFQGLVFGFPVSGIGTGATVVAVDQRGPVLWTGGSFGPEAGLLGLAAILLGIVTTLGWVRWTRGAVGVAEAVTTPDLRD